MYLEGVECNVVNCLISGGRFFQACGTAQAKCAIHERVTRYSGSLVMPQFRLCNRFAKFDQV